MAEHLVLYSNYQMFCGQSELQHLFSFVLVFTFPCVLVKIRLLTCRSKSIAYLSTTCHEKNQNLKFIFFMFWMGRGGRSGDGEDREGG